MSVIFRRFLERRGVFYWIVGILENVLLNSLRTVRMGWDCIVLIINYDIL